MLWIGLCLGLWAWCLLSLGMPKHHAAILRRQPASGAIRILRGGGWSMLAAAFAWFVLWKGWELGPILWTASLMLSAMAWVLLFTLAPRRSLLIVAAVSVAAVVTLLV